MGYGKRNLDGTLENGSKQFVGSVPLSNFESLNGVFYSHYLEADVNGFYAKDDVELQKVAILKAKADGEAVIVAHIQEPINAYNSANGVVFSDAHNCANYKTEADYVHQPFCLKAWNFNVAVWKSGRDLQDLIFSGTIPMPTAEEFKAMLPIWVD